MMVRDPEIRPDANSVMQLWRQIREDLSSFRLLARVRGPTEGVATRVVFDMLSFLKLGVVLSSKFMRRALRP